MRRAPPRAVPSSTTLRRVGGRTLRRPARRGSTTPRSGPTVRPGPSPRRRRDQSTTTEVPPPWAAGRSAGSSERRRRRPWRGTPLPGSRGTTWHGRTSRSSKLAIAGDPQQPSPAVAVSRDVSVAAFRETREGYEEDGQRASTWEQPRQRLRCGARREQRAVGAHQVPGVEVRLWIYSGQQALARVALDRDSAETLRPAPGEDLVERPLAKAAVFVVKEDVLAWSCHRGASRGIGTRAIACRTHATATGQLTNTITAASHCAE